MFVRRKVFISYYHYDDQYYKNSFEGMFGHLFINKSVNDGDISTDVSTDYVKRLIQLDYISDTSVLVVLVGPNTWRRKHVDWEISAALSKKVGGYSGLLGLALPHHPSYKSPHYTADNVPPRLVDNLQSGFASFYDWTEDQQTIYTLVNNAFERKQQQSNQINNSLPQFQRNR